MKKILFVFFLLAGYINYAQVGIGTEMPDPSAQLDIVVPLGNKGVLLPRVALLNTTDMTTIASGNVESLLVYNTATQNDVTPGFYYWYDGSWRRLGVLGDNAETITTLVNNGNGTFTYTSEDGTVTTFTAGGVMVDNSNGSYTYTNPDGTTIDIDGVAETLTVLDFDSTTGIITYTDENGDVTAIDISTAIANWETLTNIALNPDNTHIDYTDEEGNVTQLNLTALVQNLETLTTIVANADGTFTYTDEAGNATVVNIGDLETLTSLVLNPDTNTLIYTDEAGNENSIDLTTILLENQLTLTLVDGDNTTISTTVNGNDTEWQVNVPVAAGATDTTPSTLGVVKEADTNPTVTIDEEGALSVNMETINDIKEITGTYAALPTDAVLLGNASNADVTIILPAPEEYKGKKFTIKKQDANEDHYVNVYGNISGLTQLYTALPYSGWELISDGLQWKITGKF